MWPVRGVCILPVRLHVFVLGSKTSALPAASPPATRTRPSGNTVAVWSARPTLIELIPLHVCVCSAYSSALAVPPPATSTLGPPRHRPPRWHTVVSTAVAPSRARATLMLPTDDHEPVCGLNSSALARGIDWAPAMV